MLQCVAVCCSVLQCVAVCFCAMYRPTSISWRARHLQHVAGVYIVLQCVAVCCSLLQRVAACYSLVQSVTVCCSMMYRSTSIFGRAQRLHNVTGGAVCCSVLQCVAVCCSVLQRVAVCPSVFQSVSVCSNVLQCVAVCCKVSQCVAVRHSVLQCAALYCRLLPPFVASKRAQGRQQTTRNCNTLQHTSITLQAICCSVLQRVAGDDAKKTHFALELLFFFWGGTSNLA